MAVTHYDLTATFLDPEWAPFTASDGAIVAWIESNVRNTEGIVDTVANAIALGGLRKTASSTGAVSWTNLVGSDSDPEDIGLASGTLQYRVTAEYKNPVTRRRDRWVSGWFSLTADVDLADVVAEQYLPAEWVTTATAALQAIIDDAVTDITALVAQGQALLDAQTDLSNIDTSDSLVAALVAGTAGAGPLTRAALSASTADMLSGAADVDIPGLFAINDGTGRTVTDKVDVDPTAGTGNDQLALWQINLANKGRIFHFVNTGLGLSGTRDFIGMGLSEGNGLLVSVKGEGATPGQAKGINTALQADAIAGAAALFVGQYNNNSAAASFQTFAASHKPVLELVANDPAAGQRIFRVQHAVSGVYTTTEYIDSLTGVHVFSVAPDLTGAIVRAMIDTTQHTANEPRLRMQATSGQTANFIEAFPNGSTASYLFNVTAAGRLLAARGAFNTAGATGGGTLSVNGEGASLANSIFRAHASAPGDLAQFTDSASAIYSRIDKAGYFMTRKTAAPADADIATGEMALWFDSTNGAAKLKIKAKQADGTVKTGEVALA